MAADSAPAIHVGELEVLVDGVSLERSLPGQLLEAQVDDDLGLPGAFSFELSAITANGSGKAAWLDGDGGLALGTGVEIRMGYDGRMKSVMRGEITALEPQLLASSAAPRLTVRGYDQRHRLQRGTRTQTYTDVTDAEVVKKVADAAGLKVSRGNSSSLHYQYLIQANQTDLEFLQMRAEAIGYELLMIDGELVFRPSAFDAGVAATLEFGADLVELQLSLSIAALPSRVTVLGWDVNTKAHLVGQSDAGSERGRMSGSIGASTLAMDKFGIAEALVATQPSVNQAEVDARARGRLNESSLQLLQAEGRCIGRADLRVGSVIEIKGAGKRYSGRYYLGSVGYHYTGNSVETRFRARRNAL